MKALQKKAFILGALLLLSCKETNNEEGSTVIQSSTNYTQSGIHQTAPVDESKLAKLTEDELRYYNNVKTFVRSAAGSANSPNVKVTNIRYALYLDAAETVRVQRNINPEGLVEKGLQQATEIRKSLMDKGINEIVGVNGYSQTKASYNLRDQTLTAHDEKTGKTAQFDVSWEAVKANINAKKGTQY